MNLLAAEITARTGKDPGEHYRELTAAVRHAVLHAHRRAGDSRAEGAPGKAIARGGQGVRAGRRADHRQADPRARETMRRSAASKWWPPAAGSRPGRPGTENIYKIYAESFKDEKHLDAIVAEAQQIVDDALAGS